MEIKRLKKENYDACDSLVCVLAYININRYGIDELLHKFNIQRTGINKSDPGDESQIHFEE